MINKINPKKSLGQHWLYDKKILSEICALADIKPGDRVVEIGPGLGTLTVQLLDAGADVVAVEFDHVLAAKLDSQKLSDRLKVVNQDILKFNFEQQPKSYKVVANIPYYLTSNLIRVLTESTNQPGLIVLLIQKEVAERICAEPGDMSLLSVWAQMNFDCSLGPVVEAQYFTPPPKVDSQVVVMKKLDKPHHVGVDKKVLSRLLNAGFSNKRKTLHNSLSAGLAIDKQQARELLEKSDINPLSRPQELKLEDWVSLSRSKLL